MFATLLAGCSSGPHELVSGDVGAAGGRVSTPDGSATVALGASPQNVSTRVTISTPSGAPDPPSYVRPVGDAVQVDVGEQRPDSLIGLGFDPASDLPEAQPGAPRATVANAFIAVYSTDLKMWVPLASTWDPQSHMLTAVTPHFSLFRRFVVNPGQAVIDFGKRRIEVLASNTTTGVELFTDAVRSLVEFGWQQLTGAVPDDKRAACPPDATPVPGVSVTVEGGSAGDLTPCVASDAGRSWLRIQNNLGIALDVQRVPSGFGVHWNPYDEKAFDDLFYIFGYAADRAIGWQLVPPSSSVEVQLPASGSPAGTVVVRPNYLMVVVDVVTTLLSVFPATLEIEGPVLQETKLLVGSLESAIGAAPTREQAVTVLRDGITTHLQPDGVGRANAIVDFYNCLLTVHSFQPSTETVVALVQRCGKPVIDNAGHEMAGILLGAVGALKLPNEFADLAVRGRDTWGVTVDDAAAPPTLDVHAAALQAAGGPSDTIADVQCPSPVQRPTGATVLCNVVTKVPLDPAEVAVRVIDAGSGRVDSAFISGARDCSAYANWVDTLLRQAGTPCAAIDSGVAAAGPAVNVDIRTMHVGQCYNDAIDPDQGSITSCSDSHDGEVIGTVPVRGALSDAQATAACRPLLDPQLAGQVDQDVLALTWSQPTASTTTLTCRLERGTHEAPLEQPVGSG